MTHEQAVEKHAAERYLLEDMPELERFAFEEHLFACPICADDVRIGGVMQDGVKAGLLPSVKGEGTRQQAEPALGPTGPQDRKTALSQDLKTARPQDLPRPPLVPNPR